MTPYYLYVIILSFLIFNSVFLLYANCQQKSEMEILLQIKATWGNPPALSSNSTPGNHCTWIGIICTNGFITEINLSNQNITKPIPNSICCLKNLSHLDLSYNYFSGTFPELLYNCSSLQYLDISENYFIGTLPTNIDKFSSSLTYLNLRNNKFTGDIPASIGRLVGLKELYLEYNSFSTYPREIVNLTKLEYFSLAFNPSLTPAPIPHEFGNLTRLKFLLMIETNTIGEIPVTLLKLTDLELLNLARNQINGSVPSWIWSLEKLNELHLYQNELNGEINLAGPIHCLGLSVLDLAMNKLTGSIPDKLLSNLKNLSTLNLFQNLLTGELPTSIGSLPNLTSVQVFRNMLTGELPPNLGNYSKLLELDLSNNRLSGLLPPHLCAGNNLMYIILYNNNFTGGIPSSIADCETLYNIELYNNGFFGEFPSKIWSITNLYSIMIHENEFTGALPRTLPRNLTWVEIYNNHFTGEIPSCAYGLKVFRASNNSFYGELPSNLTGLSSLQELSLGSNKINGSIPQNIQVLKSLTILILSNNEIRGSIPSTIGLLPILTLTTIDLSNNALSGSIPEEISNLRLNFLNLSANHLSGRLPQSLENPAYNLSFLSNPDLCSDSHNSHKNLNLPLCHMRNSKKEVISIVATLVVLAGIGVTVILIVRARVKKHKTGYNETIWKLTGFHKFDFREHQIIQGLKEENIIGRGGFGIVYKISLNDNDNQIVAVKRILRRSDGRKINNKWEKVFNAEVSILGQIRHDNIVKLLCCISSTDSKLLVYEYMENSSLDRWLYNKERIDGFQPLDWPTRLGIAIDVAKGLCYMHHGYFQPIIHMDIKSSNILLDMKFRAKVADFGLARVLEKAGESETISDFQGTVGYIAPECCKLKKITEKADVFSFGVVLLELTTGKRANEGDEFNILSRWAWQLYVEQGMLVDIIDEDIRSDEHLHDIRAVFELGLNCTVDDPISRPSMKMILQHLNKLTGSILDSSKGGRESNN